MKTENRQRLLVIVTLSLLGLLVIDRAVFAPLKAEWLARSERIVALRKKVADGAMLMQREKSLRKRWDDMSANTLPNNDSLAEQQLFRAFDGWAQESRVSITGITPQWKSEEDDYLSLDCHLDATGDLGALSRFLHTLEKSPLALKIETVEFTARDSMGYDLAMGVRVSGLVLTPGGHP
jgi:hypothetical protein